jgi:hypothetical protein
MKMNAPDSQIPVKSGTQQNYLNKYYLGTLKKINPNPIPIDIHYTLLRLVSSTPH